MKEREKWEKREGVKEERKEKEKEEKKGRKKERKEGNKERRGEGEGGVACCWPPPVAWAAPARRGGCARPEPRGGRAWGLGCYW